MTALAVGHENQVGLFSQQSEVTYANLNLNWQVAPRVSINGYFTYSDTSEIGSFSGLTGDLEGLHFKTFALGLSTEYQLTKKLTISVAYQYNRRISNGSDDAIDNDGYTQNRYFLTLGYQF